MLLPLAAVNSNSNQVFDLKYLNSGCCFSAIYSSASRFNFSQAGSFVYHDDSDDGDDDDDDVGGVGGGSNLGPML